MKKYYFLICLFFYLGSGIGEANYTSIYNFVSSDKIIPQGPLTISNKTQHKLTDEKTVINNDNVLNSDTCTLTVTANIISKVNCNGDSNGSVFVTALGGTTPYTYSWSPGGESNDTVNGLSAGIYTVYVTDNIGCASSTTVTITQPSPLSLSANLTSGVSCNGGNNGNASSIVNGGTSPYSYTWSPGGGSNAMDSGLSAGIYTVNVIDNNGCASSTTVIITQPPSLSISANVISSVSCNGGNNGNATSVVSGGTSPYSYTWSPGGGSNAMDSGLSAGIYTVNVIDNNGCASSTTVIITQTSPLSVSANVISSVSCNGGNNGNATSIVNGGTSPYTYSWSSNEGNNATASALTFGTYTLFVTDNNGCTGSASAVISQPPPLSVSANTTANVSCNGGNNGGVSSTVNGGTSPYTYSWSSGGKTTSSATGLSAGTYSVTVTDHNGCTSSVTATVSQPSALSVSASITANISCNGSSNGSASSIVNGGTSPYTYSWSSGGKTTSSATGLSAGTYSVTVTDHNGCTSSVTATVSQPSALSVSASITANISCNGSSNGSASSIVNGGTSPYTYSWSSGGKTTVNVTGLSAGTYSVTVTDHNGCAASAAATVTQPSKLSVSASTATNVSCNGSSTGNTSSMVSGGTSPYTYSWSPGGKTTATGSGLSAGTYTVNVTDHDGCTGSAVTTITQPAKLSISATTTANVSCSAHGKGSVSSTVSGGASPYTYSWSPGGKNTATDTGLSAGTYTITVTDHNGCTGSAATTITQSGGLTVKTSVTANVSCNGSSTGSASCTASGGTSPYTYIWSPVGKTTASATGLSAGTYTIIVTDHYECSGVATATITQPSALSVTASTTANAVCTSGAKGSATSKVTGGISPYTYSWSPGGKTTATDTGLSAGTYTVKITDHNGCSSSATTTITQSSGLTITTSVTANVSCNGSSTGKASSTVSGGKSPYTYSWSPGGKNTSTDSGLSAGTYILTITDHNGCSGSAAVTITQPGALSISAAITSNVSCNGNSNGKLSASVSGGTSPYTYSWSPGAKTTATDTGLSAGTYTVKVTDHNGCTGSATATITQPSALSVSTGITANASCNGNTGSVSSSVSGGTSPYTYSWSPAGGNAATASGLSAGTYTLKVTDYNGCTGSATTTVTQTNSISVSAGATVNVSCSGGNTGSVSSTVSGGTAPYTYSWSPSGGNAATAGGLSAGIYTITVADHNGCTGSAAATITQPSALSISTSITSNVSCNGGANGSVSATVNGGTSPYTYIWSYGGITTATISGLSAGSYSITVTDHNGCIGSSVATISQPSSLSVAAGTTANVGCNGGNNGSASSTVNGGTLPYTYTWSPGGKTTATATGLSAGAYTVSVTDHNGCTGLATTTITQPISISVSATTTANASCSGSANGSASSTVSGGTSPYTYSWSSGGGNNATATGLSAATYTLTITDHNGCTASTSATITQPAAINISTSITANISCNGGNTGSASSMVNGGIAPYTYSWSSGEGNAPSATGLGAATYTLTVIDNNGCTGSSTAIITQPSPLSVSANISSNVSCDGGSSGNASAAVNGGTSPYTYTWSYGGITTATISGLSAGTYSVMITDHNGCLGFATATITQPSPLSVAASTIANVSCNGGNNGSASSIVNGGTLPYTYLWSPGGKSSAAATGLSAGAYTVSVTDHNGCTGSATITITQPTAISVSAGTTANASCSGVANGSVSSAIGGGTSPYTYSWTPSGGSNAAAGGLNAGIYTIVVTDHNGCTASAATTVSQANGVTINASVTANVSCNGNSNGSASSTVSGGASPYTYSWSSGRGTDAAATGLSAETYTISVIDHNGCTASAAVTITQPSVLSVSASITANVSCNGGSNGSLSAIVSGGTSSYTYSWSSGGGTNATFSGLGAGTYTVTLTDHNGCTVSAAANITQPSSLSVSALTTSNVSCNGGNNGSISSTVGGGSSPYTYSWSSNGGTNATATGLSAGVYTITITDHNGCTNSASATITKPTALNVTANTTANVSCNGGSNGSASSTAGGGSSPYTYSWSSGGGTNATAAGLSAGIYTLTVTDHNGCTGSANTTITQPSALSISTNIISNVNCNGGNNGSVSSAISGGISPYTYSWSSGSNNATATGLGAGTYTITVTDHNGCAVSASAVITQPAALNVSASTTANVSCNGGNSGSVSSTVNGGTSPYTYTWSSGGGTNATLSGLGAGTYTISVTDHNGCTVSVSAVITQPAALSISATTTANESCNGSSNGSVSSSAGGGASPYTYSWSPGGKSTASVTGLSAGVYTITVSDHNGCTGSVATTITQPASINVSASTTANVSCNGGNNGSVSSAISGGVSPYTYSWSSAAGTGATANGLGAGTYTLTITDHNGCTGSAATIITQPSALSISASTTANISCNGGGNGSISSTVSGGTSPYTYSWSPGGKSTVTDSGLNAGTYTITITDHNGCTNSATATITQPLSLSVSATITANVSCNGGSNGSVSSTVNGGTSPYTYSWSPGGKSAATDSGLNAGTYTITIIDHNGCTNSATATITQPVALSVSASTAANESCNGSSTGIVSSTVSGGTPPYTYSWSPGGKTSSTDSGLSAGTYTITITDHNGCTGSANTTITQPSGMSISAIVTANVNCNGGNNGSASSTVGGGTSPYTYSWSPGGGNAATASGLSAGTYTLTITDHNGCNSSATATISQSAALSVSASTTANESCNGSSTGIVSSTVSGGTSPYTYSWSPGGKTTATDSGLSAGNYTIAITDHNGCTASAVATVTQPSGLSVSASTTANAVCSTSTKGSASCTVSGGTSPYTYSWKPSGGSSVGATGLSAGTYTIAITDHNGCTSSATTIITQTSGLTITTSVTANVTCNGSSNGSASSTISGGTSPYTYSWTPSGGSKAIASGLSAGTYTITITDHNGCTNSAAVAITQPAALSVSASIASNISCNGNSNGSASATVSGGATPYTYSWSPGGKTTATLTGLSAGTYTVKATDHNGCTGSATVSITQPSKLSVSASIAAGVSCNGSNSGSASSTVSGGTSPYTYSWSSGGGNGATAGGLSAGSYTLTVNDANGCNATASVNITQPTAIRDSVTVLMACSQVADGGTVGVKGGTSPYTYSWSGGAGNKATETNLAAATYTVTVTDNKGCTATLTAAIVIQSPPATPTIVALTTDSIAFRVSNASSLVSYEWTLSDVTGNYAGIGDTARLPVWPRKATLTFYADSGTSCVSSASIHILHKVTLPSRRTPYPMWSKRGMYLEWAPYYMDSTYYVNDNKITPVVNYCRNNHITYVNMDGLQEGSSGDGWVFGVTQRGVDSVSAAHLASFIDSLKTRGGVEEVGVVCYNGPPDSMPYNIAGYDQSDFDTHINEFNYSLPWNEKVDVLSLDEEFWDDTYSASIKDFHTNHMPMLKAMYAAAHQCGSGYLRVEDYIGPPLNPDTDYTNKTQAMELDSIGLYADRILLSSYTAYPTVLWNRADWIQADSELGLNRYHAYYKKEIWPVFEPANENGTCTKCYEQSGDDFLGDSLCKESKTAKAEYMEQRYYDSLNVSEKKKVWNDNLNGGYHQDSVKGDTNFQILGDAWFEYECLNNESLSFDTNTGGTNKGYLRFYVTVGHDIQYTASNVAPITVTATVHGGAPPYSYTWYNVATGNVLYYTTSTNTYTAYWNGLSSSYPVSQLAVMVTDKGDTNATDYLWIYESCKSGEGIKRYIRRTPPAVVVEQPLIENSVKVYPNPNKGQFTVSITTQDQSAKTLEVYTLMGQKVFSQPLMNAMGDNTINISTEANGIYFYRVISDAGNLIGEGKVIVER